jgi:hypothetical protein
VTVTLASITGVDVQSERTLRYTPIGCPGIMQILELRDREIPVMVETELIMTVVVAPEDIAEEEEEATAKYAEVVVRSRIVTTKLIATERSVFCG